MAAGQRFADTPTVETGEIYLAELLGLRAGDPVDRVAQVARKCVTIGETVAHSLQFYFRIIRCCQFSLRSYHARGGCSWWAGRTSVNDAGRGCDEACLRYVTSSTRRSDCPKTPSPLLT